MRSCLRDNAIYLKDIIMEKEQISQSVGNEQINEKGEIFKNYDSFYTAFQNQGFCQTFRIYGKKVEDGVLVDDPSGFIDTRFHKITDYYANMNVYKGSEVIAYFRLNQQNISQFRIEFIKN